MLPRLLLHPLPAQVRHGGARAPERQRLEAAAQPVARAEHALDTAHEEENNAGYDASSVEELLVRELRGEGKKEVFRTLETPAELEAATLGTQVSVGI